MQPMQRGSYQERSARSIFVGNIQYDVNEQEVRNILSQVGQVVNFRIVQDRETGRPKGYGFCEFAEGSSVDLAIRSLNGYELHGRTLRIDSATGADKSIDEVQQVLSGGMSGNIPSGPVGPMMMNQQQNGTNPQQIASANDPSRLLQQEQIHNPYGPAPEPGKAPEAISRVVSSYPPEKMFQLMQDMKQQVNTNPQFARQMLIDNPQLAYALLQAQVVMRVVDAKVAYSMLHRETPGTAPFHHQQQQQQQGSAPPIIPTSTSAPGPQGGGGQQPQFSQPPPGMPPHMGGGGGLPPAVFPQGGPPPHLQQQPGQQQFQPGQPPGMFHGPPRFPQSGTPNISVPPPGMMMSHPPPIMMPPQQQVSPTMIPGSAAGLHSEQQEDVDDEETQAQMLVRVLQLTDEQIRMLPPEDREKVMELRNHLRQQVSG